MAPRKLDLKNPIFAHHFINAIAFICRATYAGSTLFKMQTNESSLIVTVIWHSEFKHQGIQAFRIQIPGTICKLQRGFEIRTSQDLEQWKRDWFANDMDFKWDLKSRSLGWFAQSQVLTSSFSMVLKWHLNTKPSDDTNIFDYSDNGLIQYPDPHCIEF